MKIFARIPKWHSLGEVVLMTKPGLRNEIKDGQITKP